MDIRTAIREQYHAGLAMLAQSVELCPDDLWAVSRPTQDEERRIDRAYWRIAFHSVYFTHLYLGQGEVDFQPWPNRRQGEHEGMWRKPWDREPYELPEGVEPQTKEEMLDYIGFVDRLIDPTVDTLDLDREDTGFPWYKDMTKLSHELMNLRHLQGHIGQLCELLLARDIDIDWVAKVRSPKI